MFRSSMLTKSLFFAALAFASLASARAQILFTTGIVTGDSSVLKPGTFVEAFNFGGTTVNINGIIFTGTSNINGTFTGYTMNGPGIDGTGGGIVPTTTGGKDTNLSAAFQNLNAAGVHNSSSNLTFSVTGLTIGQNYSLQLFIDANSADARSQAFADITSGVGPYPTSATVIAGGNKSGNPSFNGGANVGYNPAYILETFTATGTSETLKAQFGGGAGAQFSGFLLEAVPEPSTYALMGLGLAGLVFVARRKSVRA